MSLSLPFRRTFSTATIALLTAMLSMPAAAVPVVAFHADFDADTPDQMPSTSPAGDPDGDSLLLYHSAGDITVRTAVGAMTSQPLEFSRTGGPGSLHMYANLDPDYLTCSSYTVSFRKMVRSHVFFVSTSLRGSRGQLMASVEFRANGVLSYNGSTNQLSVGYVPEIPQLFVIEVDMAARETSLSIDGVPVPEAQNRPFPQISSDFRRVIPEFGGQYTETMVMDDLHVVADGCATPVESFSWGRVKASYR